MSKKILLVYPEIPTTYWSFSYALPFIGKKVFLPPLGLITVASLLPEDYEVSLIDLNVGQLQRRDIEEAELVFISAMIVQKKSFKQIVRMCNECGRPVVAGGPYPISSYEDIEGVDFFVLDEAELTLPKFLSDLEAGSPKKLYRNHDKPDITRTPPPRFDLIDIEAYDSMPLQYSRGCPYNCEFCDIIEMFGRIQRTKTPLQFVREMAAVYSTGFRGQLFIVDDNFISNRRRVKALLKEIIAWQREHNSPFSLSTQASIDLAQDDELLDLMVEAGFTMAFIGIETPDEKTLAFTRKGQNLKSGLMESILKIQKRGIEVTGGFILGFDTDPPDIFDRQIDFIQRAGIPIAMIGLLNALPNTRLYRRLKEEGRLLKASTGNNTHDLTLDFKPLMPAETLIRGYKRVIAALYSPKKYFERCSTLISRLPVKTKSVRSLSWIEIKALFLSIAKQAFSSYGIHYLRFLAAVLLTRIRLFPDAASMAIKGYHFFKITNEVAMAEEFSCRLTTARQSFQPRVAEIIRKGKIVLAVEMEKHILLILSRLQKKYRRFSRGMQQNLHEAFLEFSGHCNIWIADLQLVIYR
ncbi:MAG TPA: DUF4070 domain-containing protein [Spirochaetales bacterium]|nr:DUF4070 domain-containing protein [Spirochaetales bacterium]